MKLLQLGQPLEREGLLRQAASDDHYSIVIDEPTVAVDADGRVVFAFGHVEGSSEDLLRAVRRIKYIIDYRTGGLQSRASVFGSQPRIAVRRNFCSGARLGVRNPRENLVLESWGEYCAERMLEHMPGVHERQRKQLESEVLHHWRMRSGLFTSGIVNSDTALWYHRDAGNFHDSYSAMVALTKGIGSHGRLVIPEFDLALQFEGADWFLFNGGRWLHGVTPIGIPVHGSELAYRYTVVWYALKGCADCGTPSEELNRIRLLGTQSERKRKAVNRAELLRSLLKHGSPKAKRRALEELEKMGEKP